MDNLIPYNLSLAVLMLRTANRTQDEVASILHIRKQRIIEIEKGFKELSFSEAESLCQDCHLIEEARSKIAKSDELDNNTAIKVGTITGQSILRQYRSDYLEKNEPIAKTSQMVERELKIGVVVRGIKTAGYYDQSFGGYPEGDKELTLEVILHPAQPTTIDILNLEIWGIKIVAKVREFDLSDYQMKVKKLTPATVTTTQTCTLFFHVPKELAKDTEDAKIYAFANLREFYSEPFPIHFGSDF
jgi:DNA-binding XRE family transcriptional regulator